MAQTFPSLPPTPIMTTLSNAISSTMTTLSQLLGSTPTSGTTPFVSVPSTGMNLWTTTPYNLMSTTPYIGGGGAFLNLNGSTPGMPTVTGSIFGLPGNYSDPLILTAIIAGGLLFLLLLTLLICCCCHCCCGLPICCYSGAGAGCGRACCGGSCGGCEAGTPCCGCTCYNSGCQPCCGTGCCAPQPVTLVTRKCVPQVMTSCVNEQPIILQPALPRGRVTAVKSIDCPPLRDQICQPMNITISPIVSPVNRQVQNFAPRPVSNYQPAVVDLYTVPVREHRTKHYTYNMGSDDCMIDTSRSSHHRVMNGDNCGGGNNGVATIIFNDRPGNGTHGYGW